MAYIGLDALPWVDRPASGPRKCPRKTLGLLDQVLSRRLLRRPILGLTPYCGLVALFRAHAKVPIEAWSSPPRLDQSFFLPLL